MTTPSSTVDAPTYECPPALGRARRSNRRANLIASLTSCGRRRLDDRERADPVAARVEKLLGLVVVGVVAADHVTVDARARTPASRPAGPRWPRARAAARAPTRRRRACSRWRGGRGRRGGRGLQDGTPSSAQPLTRPTRRHRLSTSVAGCRWRAGSAARRRSDASAVQRLPRPAPGHQHHLPGGLVQQQVEPGTTRAPPPAAARSSGVSAGRRPRRTRIRALVPSRSAMPAAPQAGIVDTSRSAPSSLGPSSGSSRPRVVTSTPSSAPSGTSHSARCGGARQHQRPRAHRARPAPPAPSRRRPGAHDQSAQPRCRDPAAASRVDEAAHVGVRARPAGIGRAPSC